MNSTHDGGSLQHSRGAKSQQQPFIVDDCHAEHSGHLNCRLPVDIVDTASEPSNIIEWKSDASDDAVESWICHACIYGSGAAILSRYARRLVSNFYLLKNRRGQKAARRLTLEYYDNEWEMKTENNLTGKKNICDKIEKIEKNIFVIFPHIFVPILISPLEKTIYESWKQFILR